MADNTDTQAPEPEEQKSKLSRESLSNALFIFRYVLPYKWSFIFGMLSLALGSLLFLAIMQVPGELFNIITGEPAGQMFRFLSEATGNPVTVNQLFIIVILFLAVQSLLSYVRVRLFANVSERGMALLRTNLYENLIGLGIPFFEKSRVGELTSRLTNDVTQVQGMISVTLAEFLRQLIILLGGIAFIVFTMPRLALTMLATFPVVVIGAMFFGRYIRKLMKERQDELAQTNVVVEETLQSIQTVKAYTNEWFERSRYTERLQSAVSVALRAAGMRGLFAAFIILVMFGALFFIMWRAALMVQAGTMPAGDLVNFVVFTGIIGAAIASLGSFYTEIVSAVGATERIFAILREPVEVKVGAEPPKHELLNLKGRIEYRDIHFSYPTRPDVHVLKGISLTIEAGKRVALVGASGSGKSTIMALLQRFYEWQEGDILVDGRSIRSYDLTAYRDNLAIVPQEVLLFGGTIAENIRYGKPNATDQELIEAARQANAWEFISAFPEGLDTVVGERGIKLSGGQRQRIAIARAILRDPAILLLDEATSSLDAESERAVQEALNHLMENRTSIIIAHRLSTIRDVDRIYVIDGGRIIEEGTHLELSSQNNGAYNSLAKLQFEGIE